MVNQQVDKRLLSELEAMGFSEAQATKALHHSGNANIEAAVDWIVDHENDAAPDEGPMDPVNIDIEEINSNLISEKLKLRARELRNGSHIKQAGEQKKLEREREKEEYKVSLNVYDLSQGLARQLSTTFLGKPIEGVWHTGLVVYGTEYYFGGGIQSAPVGTTPYGTPVWVVDIGVTNVPKDVFELYLQGIGPHYRAETYSLLNHNCNHFSNEVAQFLVGASIPNYILDLPNEVMSSPMGPLMLPMLQQMEMTLRAGEAPQFRPCVVASAVQTANLVPASSNASLDQLTRTEGDDEEVTSCGEQQEGVDVVSPAGGPRENTCNNGVEMDPLGNARSRVQDEINSEFAVLMATGTLRASEAAALATKRVMQRYGHLPAAPS